MRNTIFLDGSASMYTGESLLHSLGRKSADGELSYQEILESVKEYEKTRAVKKREDVDAMTASEYKEYIAQKISALPRHDSKSKDTVIVDITDAGFAAMQEDENYERWVLDKVAQDLSAHNPLASMTGGRCAIFRFGAKEAQYSFESWGKARDVTDIMASLTAAGDAFWNDQSSKIAKRMTQDYMSELREQQLGQITRQMINMRQKQTMTALNNLLSSE